MRWSSQTKGFCRVGCIAAHAMVVLRLERDLMSASVKMLWGERRRHGTMGAVQRLPMELPDVATFSF
jgi:hypothetical protein